MGDVEANPAVKLLPFFEDMQARTREVDVVQAPRLDTTATAGRSGTLRELEACEGRGKIYGVGSEDCEWKGWRGV